jgi:hypothetical protein
LFRSTVDVVKAADEVVEAITFMETPAAGLEL